MYSCHMDVNAEVLLQLVLTVQTHLFIVQVAPIICDQFFFVADVTSACSACLLRVPVRSKMEPIAIKRLVFCNFF